MNSNSHDCIIPSSLLVYQTASPSWKLVRDSHRPYPQTQICRLKRSVKSGKGSYPLPSQAEMEKWCDEIHDRSLRLIKTWRIPKTGADSVESEVWLNDAAGNGVNEAMGWGWEGWKFWWKQRELHGLIMDGISTPFSYRLLDGRPGSRKRWDGAREAIYRAKGAVPKTPA